MMYSNILEHCYGPRGGGHQVWQNGLRFCRGRRQEWKNKHANEAYPPQDQPVPICSIWGDTIDAL